MLEAPLKGAIVFYFALPRTNPDQDTNWTWLDGNRSEPKAPWARADRPRICETIFALASPTRRSR
jgi:hypothetical protein